MAETTEIKELYDKAFETKLKIEEVRMAYKSFNYSQSDCNPHRGTVTKPTGVTLVEYKICRLIAKDRLVNHVKLITGEDISSYAIDDLTSWRYKWEEKQIADLNAIMDQ